MDAAAQNNLGMIVRDCFAALLRQISELQTDEQLQEMIRRLDPLPSLLTPISKESP